MTAQVIHDHNVPGSKSRHQDIANIGAEHCSIDCIFNGHDGMQSIARERTENADITTEVFRNRIIDSLVTHGSSIATCHSHVHGWLGEEFQPFDWVLGDQSIKKFIDPADIAELVKFLAGKHMRTISGQSFPIDGDSKSTQ